MRYLYYCLYRIARLLPSSSASHWPLCSFYTVIRSTLARKLIEEMGPCVGVEQGAHFGSGKGIKIGARSSLGIDCNIAGPCSIGCDVLMGPNVKIKTLNHRFSRTDIPILKQGVSPTRPIAIGNDVWLGDSCIILPGTVIGDGCIVGAGSVVRGEFPPMAIIVGNPAQISAMREHRT